MGKYSEAIGIWTHTIGPVEHRITPQMGDNEKIAKIMDSYARNKSQVNYIKELNRLYFDFVNREDSTLTDTDKEELQLWIEVNQMQIMEDMLIQFKWSDKDTIAKAKEKAKENVEGDLLKN